MEEKKEKADELKSILYIGLIVVALTTILFWISNASGGQEKKMSPISTNVTDSTLSSLPVTDNNLTSKPSRNIDSGKIKELRNYFRIKSDEFSNDSLKWYKPRSAPLYVNSNGIYCYFQTIKGVPSNFRFRIQYYADEWLFFGAVQFSIDGKAYNYFPSNTDTDSGNGGYIWEWSDEQVSTEADKQLIIALAKAKSAKMKLIGKQYYDIKTITKEQIASIKQTIDLYNAMGGDLELWHP